MSVDTTVRERVVESYFQSLAKEYGCKALKLAGPAGWPDRTVLWPCGVVDFVELKRPKGGRYEPMQLSTHTELRAMGFVVRVLRNRVECTEYFLERAGTMGVVRRKVSKSATVMEATKYAAQLRSSK